MYESPIDLVYSNVYKQVAEQFDENILRAIVKTGVKVDKEELIKALSYDRNQYNKGYKDGMKEFAKLVLIEIQEAIFANDKVIQARVEKRNANRYEDDLCIMCDGKIYALGGIEFFIKNLLKEKVGKDNES